MTAAPLNAEDVKFTVERAFDSANPSVTKASWGPITSAEVVDPLTVKLKLDKPFVALIPFLADSFSSIICDTNKGVQGFGTTAAIGSGPWKLTSWTKGDKIVLAKNAAYKNFGKLADNKGAPYMDGLVITTVPEPQARLAGLKTGAIQIAEPPLDDVPALKKSGELGIVIAENTGQNVFWEFAAHRPPFNDVRARQAVAYATDAAAAIDLVYGDLSIPEKCPISRGVFGNDQVFCAGHGQSYDPKKAKALLAEAGLRPGKAARGHADRLDRRQARQACRGLSEPAFRGRNQGEDRDHGHRHDECARPPGEREATGVGTMDMMTWSWYDPDILYALWHSPGAYRGYTSPELDAMLEKTRILTNEGERKTAVQNVMAYLLKNAIHVPLYTPGWEWVFAVRPDVKGFKVAPFVYPIFSDVKF